MAVGPRARVRMPHHGTMPTTLLLIADTHVPARAKRLPSAVLSAAADVDAVIHAGDWIDVPTFELLLDRSRALYGVYGNNDGPELRTRLTEVRRIDVEGLRLAVVHETGAAEGRERRADAAFPDTDVLVFGHSHIPWDTRSPGGMRLLNPGSPTDRRRQPRCTMMIARIDDRRVDVELVTVDRNA